MVSSSRRSRVAVLISGRGSNMMNLVDASLDADYPAEVVLVVSDKANAPGLDWAKNRGLTTALLDYQTRSLAESQLDSLLQQEKIDIICLAGFMRLLSAWFVDRWLGKIINIHPSLLPSFPGAQAHQDAISAGVRVSGCTLHFVDQGLDTGAIIDQRAVALDVNETQDSLASKVLRLEHELYPIGLAQVAAQQVQLIDGKAVWR